MNFDTLLMFAAIGIVIIMLVVQNIARAEARERLECAELKLDIEEKIRCNVRANAEQFERDLDRAMEIIRQSPPMPPLDVPQKYPKRQSDYNERWT